MVNLMPQEIEVWFLLPSIRRELAIFLTKKHAMTQFEVSKLIGITAAAVSQYISKKRGTDMKFTLDELCVIEEGSNMIVKDKSNAHAIIYNISQKLKGGKSMCDLHMQHSKDIPTDCRLCCQTPQK